jgi:hypothetical protein
MRIRTVFDFLVTIGVVALAIAYMIPLSYWYDVTNEEVLDSRVGEPVFLLSDRVINREFFGEWSVIVRAIETTESSSETEVICGNSGSLTYSPTSKPLDSVTLDWWSNGACDSTKLGPGLFVLETCHTIHTGILGVERSMCRSSNVFTINPQVSNK